MGQEGKKGTMMVNSTRNYVANIKNPLTWVRQHVEDLKVVSKMTAAPVIVISLIFSNYWINYFGTFMYLMAIISHATVTPGFGRAAQIQLNFRLAIVWAVSYCWALLAGYCAVKARDHAGEKEPYSASAAAVLAIFLMAGCFASFYGRSLLPKWTLPFIFVGVYFIAVLPALIELQAMDEVIRTSSLIIEAFYIGQALGLAIGLIIFPRSCRTVFMKSVEVSLLALSAVIKAQPQILERLVHEAGTEPIQQVKTLVNNFSAATTRAQTQLEVATQEWTYSHFSRGDLRSIADGLTSISAPLLGLKSLSDKLRLCLTEDVDEYGDETATEHREFVTQLKSNAEELAEAIDGAIKHAIVRLGTRSFSPGKADYACLKGSCQHMSSLEKILLKYRSMTGDLTSSAESYLAQQFSRDKLKEHKSLPYGALVGCFLGSHLILLLSATGYEVQNLLLFLEETSHKKRRLYTPIQNLGADVRRYLANSRRKSPSSTLYGLVLSKLAPPTDHDVDHLPPSNSVERLGNHFRRWWKVFDSPHAGYGARGALAIMTLTIIAFLKDTHAFYNEQRFLWAVISINFCLDRTAGSSTLKLLFRFFATGASMIASYIVWYVVDQKVPGIIVFWALWIWVLSYGELKWPRYGPAAFTALVASTVMIANQLQVRKLGAAKVETDGQAVYASYILFPFRLAQVTLGILVAYFWTLFPSPMPEHTELRRETGEACLNLATFATSMAQSITIQFGAHKGISPTDTHLVDLRAQHRAHLTEHTMLVGKMAVVMKTIPYEYSLGGKFPMATYKQIYDCITRLGDLFVLVCYISHHLDGSRLAREMGSYTDDVQRHLLPVGISTRLIILCSVLRSGHPLPPRLETLSLPDLRHFLDRRIATDESFATASLIHSANFMIMRNMNELTQLVSNVVGTLDFSLPLPQLEAEV